MWRSGSRSHIFFGICWTLLQNTEKLWINESWNELIYSFCLPLAWLSDIPFILSNRSSCLSSDLQKCTLSCIKKSPEKSWQIADNPWALTEVLTHSKTALPNASSNYLLTDVARPHSLVCFHIVVQIMRSISAFTRKLQRLC